MKIRKNIIIILELIRTNNIKILFSWRKKITLGNFYIK